MSIDTLCLLKAIGAAVLAIAMFIGAVIGSVHLCIAIDEWIGRRALFVKRATSIVGWVLLGAVVCMTFGLVVLMMYQHLCK